MAFSGRGSAWAFSAEQSSLAEPSVDRVGLDGNSSLELNSYIVPPVINSHEFIGPGISGLRRVNETLEHSHIDHSTQRQLTLDRINSSVSRYLLVDRVY